MSKLPEVIVAMGAGKEIGKYGRLPWGNALKGDLAHFRELTLGKTVIMGFNTFMSIGGSALSQRQNIVLTRKHVSAKDVTFAASLPEALSIAAEQPYIIGGGKLYDRAIGMVDVIHATQILANFPGSDTTFSPDLSDSDTWAEVSRQPGPGKSAGEPHDYDFVRYERINPIAENPTEY